MKLQKYMENWNCEEMQNGNAVFRGAEEAEAHVNEKLPAEVAEGFERGRWKQSTHLHDVLNLLKQIVDMWSPA